MFVAVILFSLNGLGKDEGALSEQVPVHARSPGKPVIRPGDPLPRYHKDMEQQQESPADIGQVRREQEQQKQAQAQEPQVGGPFDEEENPDYTGEPKERFLHPVEFSYAPDENDLVKKVTTSTERETHTDTQTHTDTHTHTHTHRHTDTDTQTHTQTQTVSQTVSQSVRQRGEVGLHTPLHTHTHIYIRSHHCSFCSF